MDNQKVKKVKSKKKKSNLIDFQKEKSAKDFMEAIKTGDLYKELKPKKDTKKLK